MASSSAVRESHYRSMKPSDVAKVAARVAAETNDVFTVEVWVFVLPILLAGLEKFYGPDPPGLTDAKIAQCLYLSGQHQGMDAWVGAVQKDVLPDATFDVLRSFGIKHGFIPQKDGVSPVRVLTSAYRGAMAKRWKGTYFRDLGHSSDSAVVLQAKKLGLVYAQLRDAAASGRGLDPDNPIIMAFRADADGRAGSNVSSLSLLLSRWRARLGQAHHEKGETLQRSSYVAQLPSDHEGIVANDVVTGEENARPAFALFKWYIETGAGSTSGIPFSAMNGAGNSGRGITFDYCSDVAQYAFGTPMGKGTPGYKAAHAHEPEGQVMEALVRDPWGLLHTASQVDLRKWFLKLLAIPFPGATLVRVCATNMGGDRTLLVGHFKIADGANLDDSLGEVVIHLPELLASLAADIGEPEDDIIFLHCVPWSGFFDATFTNCPDKWYLDSGYNNPRAGSERLALEGAERYREGTCGTKQENEEKFLKLKAASLAHWEELFLDKEFKAEVIKYLASKRYMDIDKAVRHDVDPNPDEDVLDWDGFMRRIRAQSGLDHTMCFMPLTRESYCIDKVMHPSMASPEDNRASHQRHGGDPDEDEPGSWILLWYYDEANVQMIGIWHQVRAAWSQKLFIF